MDVTAFIQSGLLETYILGFTSDEENREVEDMAALYPEVKNALELTRDSLRSCITENSLPPTPGLKRKIMKRIYREEALVDKRYVPLLSEGPDWASILDTVLENNLQDLIPPSVSDIAQALPSTTSVTNFAVWISKDLEEEAHSDFDEYIAVVSGSCVMYTGNNQQTYKQGDIIYIPPNIPHKAVVTSPAGMFALVQRQSL